MIEWIIYLLSFFYREMGSLLENAHKQYVKTGQKNVNKKLIIEKINQYKKLNYIRGRGFWKAAEYQGGGREFEIKLFRNKTEPHHKCTFSVKAQKKEP